MLSTMSTSSLSLSSSSPTDKNEKGSHKISDCQTNTSSSFSSVSSNNSFSECESIINLHLNGLSTRIVEEILPTQTCISFDDISSFAHEGNFYFKSRISILRWIDEVLDSSSLAIESRHSIYYRFAYGYLTTTYLLTKRNIFYDKIHFKVFIVALFLLCYKLEGLTVKALSIKTMVNTFLSSVSISESDLTAMIREMDIRICQMLNYNVCALENNLQQMSQLLFHIISNSVLNCNEDLIETVSFNLEQTNFEIENSNDVYLLFHLQPLERGLVSLVSALLISEPNVAPSCVDYMLHELNVTHMSKESILQYSQTYAQQINGDDC